MSGNSQQVLLDGSLLITEALVRAGADVFIGYPITPANLLYQYGKKRFPAALAAPDEISTLQWMSGFSAVGKIPVTATSFPGFALMVESINMAYMMELPMVIVLAQRLGPSTGTATAGAQGDLLLLQGTISGGYSLPTLCASNTEDCWKLAAQAVHMAVNLRTPVILLTSKEGVMTVRNFDLSKLPKIKKVSPSLYKDKKPYQSYLPAENLVPPFLPVGNKDHQVRVTASTHNAEGILHGLSDSALENTRRLQKKLEKNITDYTFFECDEEKGADTILVSYGITAQAARMAVTCLRSEGCKVSLLIAKTLFPVTETYKEILNRYSTVVIAEENYTGQFKQVLYGNSPTEQVTGVNAVGRMVKPEEIVMEVKKHA